MAANPQTLRVFITGDARKLNQALDGAGSKFGKFARNAAKVVAGAMVAIGGAIAATAVQGVRAFADFERGMNEVFTLLPDINAAAMGQMSDQVLALAKDMGTLPEDVVPALYQALSAGVPQDNVFAFLEAANKAAIAGATTLESAVDGISGVVNAYGSDVISAAQASDIIFTTFRLGKTTVEELSASLGDVTPLAAALGVSFEEVGAALVASTAITGNTAKSVTGLKALLAELGKEGQIAAGHFEDAAGKSFPEFIAAGGDLSGALDLMKQHADDTGGSLIDMFGSIEAGQSALQLTGSDAFTSALEEMGTSAGATEEAYNRMDQGLSRAMDKIRAGWEVLKVHIGEQLAPVVQEFADWIVANMPMIEEKVTAFFEGLIEWAGKAADAWGTLKGEAESLGAVVGEVWSGGSESVNENSEQWIERQEKVEEITERLGNTVARVMSAIRGEHASTGEGAENLGTTFARVFGAIMDVQLLSWGVVARAMEGIATALDWGTNAARRMGTTFGFWMAAIRASFESAMDGIRQKVERVVGPIESAVNRVFEAIATVTTILPGVPRISLPRFEERHSGGIFGSAGVTRDIFREPLRSDEGMAVLRRGEEVLPAGHPRHSSSSGGDLRGEMAAIRSLLERYLNDPRTVQVTNNNPVPERASVSTPRSLATALQV